MDGYTADLDALESGLTISVIPLVQLSEEMLRRLSELEHGSATGMVGHGSMPTSVLLNATSEAFARSYQEAAADYIGTHQRFNEALAGFRDTLREIIDRYRENEVKQEARYQSILRDI